MAARRSARIRASVPTTAGPVLSSPSSVPVSDDSATPSSDASLSALPSKRKRKVGNKAHQPVPATDSSSLSDYNELGIKRRRVFVFNAPAQPSQSPPPSPVPAVRNVATSKSVLTPRLFSSSGMSGTSSPTDTPASELSVNRPVRQAMDYLADANPATFPPEYPPFPEVDSTVDSLLGSGPLFDMPPAYPLARIQLLPALPSTISLPPTPYLPIVTETPMSAGLPSSACPPTISCPPPLPRPSVPRISHLKEWAQEKAQTDDVELRFLEPWIRTSGNMPPSEWRTAKVAKVVYKPLKSTTLATIPSHLKQMPRWAQQQAVPYSEMTPEAKVSLWEQCSVGSSGQKCNFVLIPVRTSSSALPTIFKHEEHFRELIDLYEHSYGKLSDKRVIWGPSGGEDVDAMDIESIVDDVLSENLTAFIFINLETRTSRTPFLAPRMARGPGWVSSDDEASWPPSRHEQFVIRLLDLLSKRDTMEILPVRILACSIDMISCNPLTWSWLQARWPRIHFLVTIVQTRFNHREMLQYSTEFSTSSISMLRSCLEACFTDERGTFYWDTWSARGLFLAGQEGQANVQSLQFMKHRLYLCQERRVYTWRLMFTSLAMRLVKKNEAGTWLWKRFSVPRNALPMLPRCASCHATESKVWTPLQDRGAGRVVCQREECQLTASYESAPSRLNSQWAADAVQGTAVIMDDDMTWDKWKNLPEFYPPPCQAHPDCLEHEWFEPGKCLTDELLYLYQGVVPEMQ